VECFGDGDARHHFRIRECRIIVASASGEERTITFLMFGVPQIVFREQVIRRHGNATRNAELKD
jgi:hypothetical protein